MAKWKKADFWMGEFREALPMVLARCWLDANGSRVDRALSELEPEPVLQWTGGSLELERVADCLLMTKLPEAVAEINAMLDSGLGRQISQIKHRDNFKMWDVSPAARYSTQLRWKEVGAPIPDRWHEDAFQELMAMTADHIRESAWWKANGTRFRKHTSALRSVRKVQES